MSCVANVITQHYILQWFASFLVWFRNLFSGQTILYDSDSNKILSFGNTIIVVIQMMVYYKNKPIFKMNSHNWINLQFIRKMSCIIRQKENVKLFSVITRFHTFCDFINQTNVLPYRNHLIIKCNLKCCEISVYPKIVQW